MEQSLIQRVKTQDQTVIAQLYTDYGSALYGVVHRIVGVAELSEQVMQDTFVKVWRNGPQYDESKGRLFTWMLNIARNTAIDTVRSAGYRNSRNTAAIDQTNATTIEAHTPDPHLMDIRSIVSRLDDKHRIIVEKIYFEGFTHSELSEDLGIPLGTVKTRLRAAMQDLRGMVGTDAQMLAVLVMALSKSA